MKYRPILSLLVLAAAMGTIFAWPEAVGAALDDVYTWWHYFAGTIRRG